LLGLGAGRAEEIAPEVIASGRDLQALWRLLRGTGGRRSATHAGWRRALVGEMLLSLARGDSRTLRPRDPRS
jgi:hypothetical protein